MSEQNIIKKEKDYNVLTWVFFASQGITDNINLMRCQMLCLAVCTPGATLESVKDSTGYRSCLYDIPDRFLTDEKIQEMIDWEL